MYTGVESIMAGYARYENPVYSVWKGKDLLFSNNSTDESKAEQLLRDNLEAFEQAGNNDALKIVFHPEVEQKYITNKTPICGTIYIRCAPIGAPSNFYLPMAAGGGDFRTGTREDLILEKLTGLESRIKAFEGDPEIEEDQTGVGKVMGTINQLMENPAIAAIITNVLSGFVPGIKQPLQQVAGVPESAEFTAALNYLATVDSDFENDIVLLAKMAKEQRQQFNWLLTMLRKG